MAIRDTYFGLLSALAAVVLMPATPAARAQVISNTASAEWTHDGQRGAALSNRVDVTVVPRPSEPPRIATYRLTNGGGDRSVPLAPTQCVRAGNGTVGALSIATAATIPLSGVYAGISTAPASLQRSDSFRAGEMLVVGVTLAAANDDPQVRDTLPVVIELENGDRESIILTETTANSGEFVGFINTIGVPPAVTQGDCRLSVDPGAALTLRVSDLGDARLVALATIDFLVDPFGIVFDSGDGAPVPGSRVTIVDAATGQPADVFGDDGVSTYPSSVITGQRVTDSGGTVYDYPAGDYRFPFVAPGSYRLIVEPPAPFAAPSAASPADLAAFRRPDDGQPFAISDASYGRAFTLNSPAPVRVDIPVDQPGLPLVLRKTTSTQVAVPGDVVQYRIEVANRDSRRTTGAVTVRDVLPAGMRLRADTVRVDGVRVDAAVEADGRAFTVTLPGIAAAQSARLTYLAEVVVSAQPGSALNRASATDNRGTTSNVAEATIAIKRDQLGDRMTIIGRITDGGCAVDPGKADGIMGVRVMLQDGSYTVTDEDGRYHFEGVLPGLHVVQIDPSTLPLDRAVVDCARSTQSAGSAISRFVEGRGGALKRADFRAAASAPRAAPATAARPAATPLSDPEAAGAHRDWLTGQEPGIGWLFPATDHNPRARAIRAAIKHAPGQIVTLRVNGQIADPLTFEGVSKSADGAVAVSLWRGLEIREGDNRLVAEVKDANGITVETLERTVHYSITPMRAALVREKSVLVADGVTRPVIAVRLTDRDGKPIRAGLTGDFSVPAPYYPAVEADAQQARQLSGLERAPPVWKVDGDDGIAYIELEPTTASGTLAIDFLFRDDRVTHKQVIETWLDPGDRPWTVVGFAAGTLGYNTLDDRMEPVAETLDDLNADARLALYAKGRVRGKWLMTLAYDSDKEADDARFGGVIDPRAYYTIYADRNETRYDAASVRKLYLRLERPQFYAMFGDIETGISEPELARYQRALNGGKAEYRGRNIAATAFVADTPYRFRRDEIQGNGLTGPYQLGARDILPNSERIVIETRDRLHSERIVESVSLSRHVDYDIDYQSGTIRFRAPVLSRSSALDPQFIVAEYEVDGVGQRVLNAGGRVSYRSTDEKLRVGATVIHDEDGNAKTDIGGIDARYRPNIDTEVRAELAVSDAKAMNGSAAAAGTAKAWLIEAEHHGSTADFLAYIREREAGFGAGQLNRGEDGTRKFGFDARLRATRTLALTGSAWQEDYPGTDARRRAARALVEYDNGSSVARAGLTYADDRLSDGSRNRSTIVQLGATQRLFAKRLELDAQTEFALGGKDASVDFPARHRLGARFGISRDVNLVGSYEIADGDTVRARTARLGFDLTPWVGARLLATANRQDIGEYGPRSFAAYGLSQSLRLGEHLSVDVSVDGNRTIGGISARDVLNAQQPVASGGFLGGNGTLTEDFLAISTGATYRADRWTLTGRAEYRDGELANRYGLTLGGLRQLGEGRALGALFTYAQASGSGTVPTTEVIQFEMSWAHRPADSRISWLGKGEFRSDRVRDAVAGQAGPIGGALTIDGDATSRRLLGSLSVNWTPLGERGEGGMWYERAEFGVFWGTRYNFDRFGADDVKGWSNLIGADVRVALGEHVDVGASGTIRVGTDADTVSWAGGPTLTLAPMKNANITLGYNFAGFHDRDFEDARFSRSGAYVTFKLKFDQTSFAGLGL
ncbi:DUF11 domain-containing protein [Sphingopyxis alaskensis]|jgi:uncharacterized repeat protein (TIGR01451 family)|uniref:DUF11 domain-containing protein n=1 Tax=Sphingopyxis alaskensis (strain DSM 13593 / LMG 18877 / RB2256) TaxID=317655 RepID=Q1GTI0_SPHAL|nr:DUF11 domain-containing protein [Sphingopyxis alaskensis]ABF53042.1 Protein of unknown function DUF11 [Sphingopyxis alaskensis RB2256]MCM3420068.1 DUF11 domain-containing protein [Sphingopyxis alaskensis]